MIFNFFNFHLQYNEALSLTRLQWFSDRNGLKYFRQGMEQVAYLMEQNVVQYGIVDLHDMPNISLEDQLWTATSWLPRSATPDLKQAALVFPASSLYNQLAIESVLMIGRIFVNFEVHFFSSIQEALDSLIGQYDPAAQQAFEDEWDQYLVRLS